MSRQADRPKFDSQLQSAGTDGGFAGVTAGIAKRQGAGADFRKTRASGKNTNIIRGLVIIAD